MLFSHICWKEKYKNLIVDGIVQIWLCIRSHFLHEKEHEGKIFSLWSAQDWWKHLPIHQKQVIMWFWRLALSISSMKYVVEKLNNSFTVSSHVGRQIFSQRERILPSFPSPDESEIWNKANLYNTVFVCVRVC